jgi:hypothetical protein
VKWLHKKAFGQKNYQLTKRAAKISEQINDVRDENGYSEDNYDTN